VETPSAIPCPGDIVSARIARHSRHTRVREDRQPGDPALPSPSHASGRRASVTRLWLTGKPCCRSFVGWSEQQSRIRGDPVALAYRWPRHSPLLASAAAVPGL
jgi:hypothetical protein